jgi:hypothetical protein
MSRSPCTVLRPEPATGNVVVNGALAEDCPQRVIDDLFEVGGFFWRFWSGHSPPYAGRRDGIKTRLSGRSECLGPSGSDGRTSAMLVVHAGDRIPDGSFHSRLNPCDAVTASTCRYPLRVRRRSARGPGLSQLRRPQAPAAGSRHIQRPGPCDHDPGGNAALGRSRRLVVPYPRRAPAAAAGGSQHRWCIALGNLDDGSCPLCARLSNTVIRRTQTARHPSHPSGLRRGCPRSRSATSLGECSSRVHGPKLPRRCDG